MSKRSSPFELALSSLFAIVLTTLIVSPASAQTEGEVGAENEDASDEILNQVEPMLARIAGLRGIEPKGPIEAGIYTREDLREVLLQKIADQITPEEIRAEALVLQHFGVLSPEVDYYELMLEILMSQIAGFYDEDTQQLFLLDDLPTATQVPTMAHELFHGIQDQIYGIEKIRPDWIRGTDVLMATMALIEGDATAVMIDFSLGGTVSFTDIPNFMGLMGDQVGAMDELAAFGMPENVPDYLQDELFFPYMEGLAFVHFVKSAGGWAAVDEVYDDLPVSTEQVIHPERYTDRDLPTWIDFDLAPIEELGYSIIFDQVFGEFRWSALFRDRLSDELSERAIDNGVWGWDGDRLVALESESGLLVLAALSVWDSPNDAREFQAVLQRQVEQRAGVEMTVVESGQSGELIALKKEDHWTVIERWGDMILYLDGVPHDQSGDEAWMWRELIWSSRQRSVYPAPPEPSAPPPTQPDNDES